MPTPPRTSNSSPWALQLGATPLPDGSCLFRVWAPRPGRLSVQVLTDPPLLVPLQRQAEDIFECVIPEVREGADYFYVIDDLRPRPDPVSRSQPQGVHGPSRVVDPLSFQWTDSGWSGLPLSELVFYEIHTGTFTPEGTFEAIIPKLPYLRDLGITALELMPIASYPGGRNWGYDGVHLYAPQCTQGGTQGLKALVDACHSQGLAIALDVVYNHLGPEGNYLPEFAPYMTPRYRTPWGEAVNFDGPESDGVRRHVLDNARYWLTEFHIDALRIDAIHGIFDFSARHILDEMRETFHNQAHLLGRAAWLIAESDLNDVRVLHSPQQGGYGIDAQWSDDYHRSFHAVLSGNRQGYFGDYGSLQDVRKALVEGFVYDGRRSRYRKRRHGSSARHLGGHRFVVYSQNHDQIANACLGDRLSTIVSLEQQKIAAVLLLCAPSLPLLFMGQEYGEVAPFHYFISHGDPALVDAVREGRRAEFAAFDFFRDFPDPQDRHTFELCRLDWHRLRLHPHRQIHALHRDLLRLRRSHPALANGRNDLCVVDVDESPGWLTLLRQDPEAPSVFVGCNFSPAAREVPIPQPAGAWRLELWSGASEYAGPADGVAPPALVEAASLLSLAPWTAAIYLALP